MIHRNVLNQCALLNLFSTYILNNNFLYIPYRKTIPIGFNPNTMDNTFTHGNTCSKQLTPPPLPP